MNSHRWQLKAPILSFKTPWLTLMGEILETPQGELLNYWRIEKADSVIILPIYQQHLLLPSPVFRPGVGKSTWDFPGGRCPPDQTPDRAAKIILQRELGIAASSLQTLYPLNQTGWAINSSFSNQHLYGFVAEIKADHSLPAEKLGAKYPITPTGIGSLLDRLTCLQCRSLLLTWQISCRKSFDEGLL